MIRRLLFLLLLPLSFPSLADSVDATYVTTAKTTQYRAKEENGTPLGVYSSAQSAGDAACAASNASAVMGGDPWVYTGPAMRAGCVSAPSAGNYVAAMGKRTSDNATLCVGCGKAAGNIYSLDTVLACPSGYTFNASANLCEKYSCPAGYEGPVASGGKWVCNSPNPCESKAGESSFGWVTIQIGGPSPYGSKCNGGCSQYVTGPVSGPDNPNAEYYTNGKYRTEYAKWQFDGSACSAGEPAPTASTQPPPRPPKEPVCAAGEGVMTTSTGKVHCVPSATPQSSPPKVDKSSETKTFPDGSKLTTETTKTTDTTTGVTDTKTTSTASEKTGGGTGQAGTPGTTSGSSSSSTGINGAGVPDGTGNSDFCSKNPGLQICKGGMNEEATQKEVRDELKKLTDPGTTSTDPLKNATHTTESENQLKTENDKFTDAAKGITDPTASSKTSWQQAMESGWFSAIPSSGCTPITGTVGGRQFTIDHCEKASQISDIMSYALWYMLVVGSFVMFTGGQVRTQ